MRILHTADWHLGKLFYGNYLTEDQAYVLEQQFLPLLRDEGIDAVVLAGDVYDRSLPPAEAVELFDDIATKITADLKIPFLVISGNHDSPARLSFASRLLAPQGLYIAGELDRLTGPVVLEDEAGPVAFLTIPYAEQKVTSDTIRYAGSLLKYSFGEARQHKGAVIADIGADGQVDLTFRDFAPRHDVRIVSGSFEAIMAADDDRPDDFILARLDDTQPILDGMAKLRRKYPNAMALEMPNRNTQAAGQRDFDLQQVTERELFTGFAQAMRPDQPLTEAERACVRALWDELEKGGSLL